MANCAIFRRLVLLALLVLPVAAYADLRSDMVKLDQAYVPALVLSGQGKALTALAMDSLLDRWDWFKQRQAYRQDRDTQWNFDLTIIERSILNAKRWVDQGGYTEAHKALEQVRFRFMQMRQRLGLDYLPDTLLDFHQSMEALLELMEEGEGSADEDALRLNYERASSRWEDVMDWPINPYEYGLTLHSGEEMRKQMLDEQALLKRFGEQMAAGDREAMNTTLKEIKRCFIQVYRNFGHFPQPPETAAVH